MNELSYLTETDVSAGKDVLNFTHSDFNNSKEFQILSSFH